MLILFFDHPHRNIVPHGKVLDFYSRSDPHVHFSREFWDCWSSTDIRNNQMGSINRQIRLYTHKQSYIHNHNIVYPHSRFPRRRFYF